MPWTDGNGDTGSYTGEVNSLNIPDGMGSMRYDNGIVAEGSWKDGEIDTDDTSEMDDRSAMSYHFGGGVRSSLWVGGGLGGNASSQGLGVLGPNMVRHGHSRGGSASVQ